MENLLASLSEYEKKYNKAYCELLDHEAKIEEEADNRNTSVTNTSMQFGNQMFITTVDNLSKFLCPFTLTTDHNPQELHHWIRKMWQYFKSGNISKLNIEVQQAQFEACINDAILREIAQFITPSTPVFGQMDASN